MTPQEVIKKLRARFGEAIGAPVEFRGEFTITVAAEKIVEVCQFLKAECAFDVLTDLSGVDNYGEDPRYEVDYHLYSLTHHGRLRLKIKISEEDMTVDTVSTVRLTADWHEREAFDMIGIRFHGHPNLKRILMWDGYPYYPLRKDFPLAGLPTELPETAVNADKVRTSSMLGGPFVAPSGTRSSLAREPRQADTVVENIERLKHPTKKEAV